jgi:hypothetical protein
VPLAAVQGPTYFVLVDMQAVQLQTTRAASLSTLQHQQPVYQAAACGTLASLKCHKTLALQAFLYIFRLNVSDTSGDTLPLKRLQTNETASRY